MRFFGVIFAILCFVEIGNAQQPFCDWGYVAPDRYRCEGEWFIYGSPMCGARLYKDIFCHERHYRSGEDCKNDEEPKTIRCFERLFGPIDREPSWPDPDRQPSSRTCNWGGYVPPEIVTCEGREFKSGLMTCSDGTVMTSVFCHRRFGNDPQRCIDDESEQTIRCYNRDLRSRRRGTGPITPPTPSRRRSGGGVN